jgi:hypothetical protein
VSTFFRLHPEDEDPQELLEPENQVSKPWGGADLGACDKCGQSCRTTYRHDGEEYEDVCPTCKGSGEITETQRRGVSVFRSPDTLYEYMLRRDSDMANSVLVELEGTESDDPDWDADEGALLVFPKRIVHVTDVDRGRVDDLKTC